MNTPFFSIVIPSHNRPHLLERALQSIFSQDFSDYEIIVVNDGSTVSYDDLIGKHESRIQKFIRHDTSQGVSAARNSGIQAARGKWVTFLDDDDEFNIGFLSKMHECLMGVADDVGFSWTSVRFQNYDAAGNLSSSMERVYQTSYPSERKLYENAVSIGTGFGLTVKRSCFEKAGLFDTTFHLGEDTEFVLRLLSNGCKPIVCGDIGITVHTHGGNSRHYQSMLERVNTRIFERIAERHLAFMKPYPEVLTRSVGFGAWLSYVCRDFASGDRLLFAMLRSAPLSPHIWLCVAKTVFTRGLCRFTPYMQR